jgi:hypothetical protein
MCLIWWLSKMLEWEEWMEVKEMRRQGHSIKDIAE